MVSKKKTILQSGWLFLATFYDEKYKLMFML